MAAADIARHPRLFRVDSWIQVLLGQRLEPVAWHYTAQLLNPTEFKRVLAERRTAITTQVARLPSHESFATRYCAKAKPPAWVTPIQ